MGEASGDLKGEFSFEIMNSTNRQMPRANLADKMYILFCSSSSRRQPAYMSRSWPRRRVEFAAGHPADRGCTARGVDSVPKLSRSRVRVTVPTGLSTQWVKYNSAYHGSEKAQGTDGHCRLWDESIDPDLV